jgi:hypothetical protein
MAVESLITDILNELRPRCALTNFALIAGILSPARVNTALNGQKPFDSQDALLYLNVARRLKALQDAAAPLPIDWSETETIKAVLAAVSDKTLHISVHRERPIVAPERQYNVFLGNMYFVRRARNILGKLEIIGSYQGTGASRVSKDCGDKLVTALVKAGYRAQLIPSNSIDSDGACDDFAALWGSEELEQVGGQ